MDKPRAQRALEAITAAILVLVSVALPLMFSTQVLHPFSSPKLLVLVLAALLAGVGLCVGAAAGLPGNRNGSILLGVLIICALLALAASPIRSISVWGQPNQEVGVVAVVAVLILGGFSLNYASLPADSPWLWWLPLAAPVVLATLAIGQRLGLHLLPLFEVTPGERPFLTLGNPVHLGLYLGAGAVFAGALCRTTRGRGRLAAAAACALCTVGFILTGTSSALPAVALAALYLIGVERHWRFRSWLLAICLLCLAAVGLYGVYRMSPEIGVLHVFATAGGNRLPTYLIALETIAGHPLAGVGPANFRSALLAALTPDLVQHHFSQEIAADAHSILLEFGATYGFPFAVLFAVFVFGSLSKAKHLRVLRVEALPFAGALAVLVVGYLFQPLSLATLPMITFYAGVVWRAGTSVAPDAGRVAAVVQPQGRGKTRRSRPVGLTFAALATVLAVGGCVLAIRFAATDYQSRQADLAGDAESAFEAAERLRPGSIPPYLVTARLAAFDARFDGRDEALPLMEKALLDAKLLDPRDPTTELSWAVDLQLLERHEEAIEHLNSALGLYPDWPLARKGIAFSYLELGRPAETLAILEPLLKQFPSDKKALELLDEAQELLKEAQ